MHWPNNYAKTDCHHIIGPPGSEMELIHTHMRLDQARTKEVEQNRNRLHPMVDTILTCARQNIALRGHRFESEPLAADGEEQDMDDGHFRALLRYRIRGGDSALIAHVMDGKRKCYIRYDTFRLPSRMRSYQLLAIL